jgi:RNA polymerase sigma-70 factor (ECF subfamily)
LDDERALALRAQQGDADAFGALIVRHQELAFRVAYLHVRDEAEAQDVAQEAFVRAYKAIRRFDAAQPFRPWLLRIVVNLASNSRRSAGRRAAMALRYQQDNRQSGHGGSPLRDVEASDEAQRVWAAVSQLGREDQTVVYLRYFMGASEEETAVAIGRPVGTVKSRTHRALRKLRGVIEERYPDLIPESVLEARQGT